MQKPELLLQQVNSICTAEQLTWLTEAQEKLSSNSGNPTSDLLTLSAGCQRRFPQQALLTLDSDITLDLASAVRIYLIVLAIAELSIENSAILLSQYFKSGDSLEKTALLKSLSVIDDSGHYIELALFASRVNDAEVFAALSLNNPYPLRYFPLLNWNQLVLKSLHLKLDINAVKGLSERTNPTLSNMVADYIVELLLANREYPASAWQAIVPSHLESIDNRLIVAAFAYDDLTLKQQILESIANSSLNQSNQQTLSEILSSEQDATIRLLIEKLLSNI